MKNAFEGSYRLVLLTGLGSLFSGCIVARAPQVNTVSHTATAAHHSGGSTADSVPSTQCRVARAAGESGILDDFEDNPLRIRRSEGRDGFWFAYDDGSGGKMVREHTADDSRVLHLAASGYSNWGAGFGASMLSETTGTRACAYDASTYSGIRFRARGKGRVRVVFSSVTTTPQKDGGHCKRAKENCYDYPGVWVDLKEQWQTVELLFNAFVPEGWGGDYSGLDPSELVSIQFRFPALVSSELWLDDLGFFKLGPETATADSAKQKKCPLDAVPAGAKIDPTSSTAKLKEGLSLHTFQQATKSCGTVTRRYISYVPNRLEPRTSAPIVMALHGSEGSAELMQVITHGRFEELSARDGFVVVYGNAAPGAHTDPSSVFPTTGAWRQAFYDDGEVDDVEYIFSVLDDLKARGVTTGTNAVYLTGISNGGGMVLKAAKRAPERFRAIAPLMAYDDVQPTPVPELRGKGLNRVLFMYTPNDPGLPSGYCDILQTLPAQWARALGLPQTVIANPKRTELPNLVREGDGYSGNSKAALATLNSRATQYDMGDAHTNAWLRLVVLDHAGHGWPNPVAENTTWVVNRLGFHNQDFDAADLVWDFFSTGTTKAGHARRGKVIEKH